LLAELQARGVAQEDGAAGGRRGGAGPSDHRALTLGGTTVMVPMRAPGGSPFRLRVLDGGSDGGSGGTRASIMRDDQALAEVELPASARFYALSTADGIPYSKIALLHARRVIFERAGLVALAEALKS